MIHYPFKKITTVFTILLIFCFVFGIRYASQRLSLEKEELEKEREKLQKEMNFNN
jgi:hypothetical protein